MADTGTGVLDGVAQVAEAGKRVKMPTLAGAVSARSVVIQALSTNEGRIAVGAGTVVAAPGTHATPTQRGAILSAGDSVSLDIDDTAQIYLDATVSGDGVSYLAMLA